jgi:hypothetical protein
MRVEKNCAFPIVALTREQAVPTIHETMIALNVCETVKRCLYHAADIASDDILVIHLLHVVS